jgi:NAD(P)-dependent dehydrogenase (short-subunit alcohol dehydrogenase family)
VERLAGKVAIVTGAGGGIGAATARRLDAERARLVLVGRAEEKLREVAGGLDGESVAVAVDLTGDGAAEAVVARAREAFGRVDVLVNNAAMDHTDDLLEASEEDVRRVFDINFFAAASLLQAAARAMRGEGGSIVNVSSRLAAIGVPTMGFYGASKGALNALTRHAAIELAPLGVRVNAVAPGMTRTPLLDEWLADQPDPAATEAEVASKIPLGELATPADVAAAIAFLASTDAAHVTGVVLPVDGGYTAA